MVDRRFSSKTFKYGKFPRAANGGLARRSGIRHYIQHIRLDVLERGDAGCFWLTVIDVLGSVYAYRGMSQPVSSDDEFVVKF